MYFILLGNRVMKILLTVLFLSSALFFTAIDSARSENTAANNSGEAAPKILNVAPPVRQNMHEAYDAFKTLQKFTASRTRFEDPANEREISTLLSQLKSTFHSVDKKQNEVSKEPGFVSTLQVLNEMLDDARTRFGEGKKGYALWRMKTVSSYCISCHTRYELPIQFSDEDVNVSELNAYEQGEFFLATRQLDRATQAFLKAATDPGDDVHRMDALRHWLLVYTRANPNSDEALSVLTKLLAKTPMRAFDQVEVQDWIASLRRWKSESAAKIPPLVRAENLVRQGLGGGDVLTPNTGTVELLRATALLHKELEGADTTSHERRGHVLYLLGLAYSRLPYMLVTELPELFLEQSIREVPGSDTARNAYRRYEELVTSNFTGSGGTKLPDDIRLKFKELHDQAFGVPAMRSAV